MKTRYYIVSIVVMMALGLTPELLAQEVVPLKIDIDSRGPDGIFPKSKLRIEVWIQESQKFMGLDTSKTKIIFWKDNLGVDLLVAHKNTIQKFEQKAAESAKNGIPVSTTRSRKLIDYNNTVGLRDTIGFKLVLENWAVPSGNSTSLKLKGDLVYFVLSNGEVKSAILKNIILNKIETIEWQGKRIPINYSGYAQINGEYLISYKINSSDLGVAVEKVEQLNENGEVIKQLSRFAAAEKVYFEVNNKDLKSPMNLKFTYRPLQEVVLDLNEEFAIKAYKKLLMISVN